MNITRINGNGNPYTVGAPRLVIISKYINEVALNHIKENTGLIFRHTGHVYEVKPKTHKQVVTLLMTYNFRMWNYNNAMDPNTIFLKFNNEDLVSSNMAEVQKGEL